MAEEGNKGLGHESWLLVALIVTVLMAGTVITLVSAGKDAFHRMRGRLFAQLPANHRRPLFLWRSGMGYTIANTMSTPMLVNDWKNPRTLLIIAAPEKLDAAEAAALHDFVTKKGGKVILASNSSNAQPVADLFGVSSSTTLWLIPTATTRCKATTATPAPDARRSGGRQPDAQRHRNAGRSPSGMLEAQVTSRDLDNCRLPVLFHRPTAIQVLEDQDESGRTVSVLTAASTPAFIARADYNPDNIAGGAEGRQTSSCAWTTPSTAFLTPLPAAGKGRLGSREASSSSPTTPSLQTTCGRQGKPTPPASCNATVRSTKRAMPPRVGPGRPRHRPRRQCMGRQPALLHRTRGLHDGTRQRGVSTVYRTNSNFNVVFDESRHVAGALTMPFTEAVGAVVLLTSDGLLKWLIGMNLFALWPSPSWSCQKENWRHVFDLTRFRERPTKLDPTQYQRRTREAFLSRFGNSTT